MNLSASTDLKKYLVGAKNLVVATSTNYNDDTNYFNTETVEFVVSDALKIEPNAIISLNPLSKLGLEISRGKDLKKTQ